MKSRKFGFLRHYRKIKIEGINLSRLVNKCIKNGIDLRNLRYRNELESTFEIKNDDFDDFRRIAGHSYKISVLKEGGIHSALRTMKTNLLTITGAFLLGALIFYQSLFIAEIRIDGYRTVTEKEIRQVLAEQGIEEGSRKLGNYNEVKTALYKSFDQLTWISFYEKGRLLKVNVAEAGNIEEAPKISTVPAHIVADKSGFVEKIIPQQGNAKVKKGDYVNKGDILISGKYKYQSTDYSKGDKVFTLYSHAQGQVMARVPKQLIFYVEKNNREFTHVGKIIPGLYIKAGDFELDTTRSFCKYNLSQKTEKIIVDISRLFPFKIGYVKVHEIEISEKHQSMSKVKKVVEAAVRQYAKENFKKGEYILSQTIDFTESEGVIKAVVYMEIIEDIGVEKAVKINKNK